MTKIKGFLLGATAGLLTVASAQAADLPIKAKPVEYVKVCNLYGAGFFYIPGTDTCLKIGGYLRSDHAFGSGAAANYYLNGAAGAVGSRFDRTDTDMYSFRARINLTVDFRTQSDYGTIRAYAAIIGQQSQAGEFGGVTGNGNGTAGILRAFIQFAGFTVGHAVSYYDFMNGADYGYVASIWSTGTGVNGTDLVAYTWQLGNGFSASIDIEDGGNGQGGAGTGRGKTLINSSLPASFAPGLVVGNDQLRAVQPDLAGNLRVDQAWGSAQIMAALHNASGGYYNNVPGVAGNFPGTTGPTQPFGHPGEAWGYAVGTGAKFVNFLLPKDMIEFQVNYCHGATAYCFIPGLYSWNWAYGDGNTVGQGFAVDGVFNNGGQVQLSDAFSYAVGYQHYWNPQWRTSLVGGQTYQFYNSNAQSQLCGTAPGSLPISTQFTPGTIVPGTLTKCSPNFGQTAVSTRTAWNPHPFLEIGLDLIWYHLTTANNGAYYVQSTTNGGRGPGVYKVTDQDNYLMVLRFQKNILP